MQVAVPTGVVEGQLMVKLLVEYGKYVGRLLDKKGRLRCLTFAKRTECPLQMQQRGSRTNSNA